MNRSRLSLVLAIALALGATPAALAGNDRLSPKTAERANAGGAELVDVIVVYDRKPGKSEKDRIRGLGATKQRGYEQLGMKSMRLPAQRLDELSRGNGVKFVALDEPVAAASAAARATARLPAPGSASYFPVASDVGIAVLDSGVAAHSDLSVTSRVDFTSTADAMQYHYLDQFNATSHTGSDGNTDWSASPWIETGDNGSPSGGSITVEVDYCPDPNSRCVEFDARGGVNDSFEREMDLSAAVSASMSFDYRVHTIESSAEFVLEASADGGVSWDPSPLAVYNSAGIVFGESVDLTPFISAQTRIRFRVTDYDPEAHLYLDNVRIDFGIPAVFRDEFNTTSHAGSDGSLDWSSSPWIESGDDASPSSGSITVETDYCPDPESRCVEFDARGGVGDSLERQVDLSDAVSASLSFDYRMYDIESSAEFVLEASTDGGATWDPSPLAVYNSAALVFGENIDLTSHISAQTRIRFRVTDHDPEAHLYLDNIQVRKGNGDQYDAHGHGSHVAGIIGGNGSLSGNAYIGVAPNASIHSVRVMDAQGRGMTSDVIAGLDWVLAKATANDIRVVNMSLGKAVEESAATDPLVQAVEQVWDAGIVVVASAGNYGRDGNMTVTSPGNSPKIITVGSLTDKGTGNDYSDDFVSTFSSMGPTLIDHYLKPDLLAPGNRLVAAMPGKSKMRKALPNRAPACGTGCSDQYLELSGTSMAAAMVSGAAALMLSQDPSLIPATVKARLMRSARKIAGDATATGAGVLDVEAALAETGVITGEALSPKMARSDEGPVILVEDTARLWGDPAWAAGYIWTDGYMWTDSYLWTDGYIWTDGYLWTDGYVWTDGYIWTDGYLWTDSYMWTDSYLWTDAVMDLSPLYGASAQGVGLNDD